MNMTLDDWSNVANIIGVSAAVTVYIANSLAAKRQRMIENLERYLKAHNKVFGPDSYPLLNVQAMEKGQFKRDSSNNEMEVKFNRFLSDLEHIALLRTQALCQSP